MRDIVDVAHDAPYSVAVAVDALNTVASHLMSTDLDSHVTEAQNLHCVDKPAGVVAVAVAVEHFPRIHDVAKCSSYRDVQSIYSERSEQKIHKI